MNEYPSEVHHEKLNLDFSIKISAKDFKGRKDDDVIDCFDNSHHCRKFLKSFLTVKWAKSEEPSSKKEKKILKEEEEIIKITKEPIPEGVTESIEKYIQENKKKKKKK
jgi:hypothetical protein